jgi:hypothetical protein
MGFTDIKFKIGTPGSVTSYLDGRYAFGNHAKQLLQTTQLGYFEPLRRLPVYIERRLPQQNGRSEQLDTSRIVLYDEGEQGISIFRVKKSAANAILCAEALRQATDPDLSSILKLSERAFPGRPLRDLISSRRKNRTHIVGYCRHFEAYLSLSLENFFQDVFGDCLPDIRSMNPLINTLNKIVKRDTKDSRILGRDSTVGSALHTFCETDGKSDPEGTAIIDYLPRFSELVDQTALQFILKILDESC